MNDYELSLIKKNPKELGEEETKRIYTLVAMCKKLLDVLSIIPNAPEEFKTSPKEFLKKWYIELSVEDAKFLALPDDPKEKIRIISNPKYISEMPESFFRYRQYIMNKIAYRDRMINTLCVPDNEKLAIWRERQINRCYNELGGVNKAFVHAMVTYELADGCSVGCEFCGLNAGRLKQIFRYTPENAELFKGVLSVCREVFGNAAGYGMMYFATEPLDNPDYELFEDDFYAQFKQRPQITTAVCDRDIERTRAILRRIMDGSGFSHRFTIRSEEMARKVLDTLSASELLFVELLPQYPEAPAFVPYVKVGKLKDDSYNEKATGDAIKTNDDSGTIVCIDGFAINFCRKTITVFTPCHESERHPKGIAEKEAVTFDSIEDFKSKLNMLIDKYFVNKLPEGTLQLYDFLYKDSSDNGEFLKSLSGVALKLDNGYMSFVVDLLSAGSYTKEEIAKRTVEKCNVTFEKVYWLLNNLWKKGFIKDRVFFD